MTLTAMTMTPTLIMSHSLIRKEYLSNGNDFMLSCCDKEYNRESFSIKQDCEKTCKVEFNEKYYSFDIDTKDRADGNNLISINPNEYLDIYVKYIPQMNVIDFFLQLWWAFRYVVRSVPF